MPLQVEIKDINLIEERIAVACCHSDAFIEKYIPLHHANLFQHFELAEVVQWCIEYWQEYTQAPKQDLSDLLATRAPLIPPVALAPLTRTVERITEAGHEVDANADYLYDRVRHEFRIRKAKQIRDKLDKAIDSGDIDSVEDAIQDYQELDFSSYVGINPFDNPQLVYDAFESASEPLFSLPGIIGQKLNKFLNRGSFVTFTGPEKRGKTYFLYWLARRAYLARLNVVVVQAGDLDDNEGIQRLYMEIAGKNIDPDYCGRVFSPVADCMKNQFDTCVLKDRTCNTGIFKDEEEYDEAIENGYSKWDIYRMAKAGYKPCTACRHSAPQTWVPGVFYEEVVVGDDPLDASEAWAKGAGMRVLTKGKNFRMLTYPNSSISIAGIDKVLARIERKEGWSPDVIVIDYMCILADEPECKGNDEFRHKDDAKWKAAKALAQRRRCLLVSASQGTRGSHKKSSLDTDDISENKRRLAHINFMGSLNQTPDEKRRGILRIGTILQRSGRHDPLDEVALLQCLERGRAVVDSYPMRVKNSKEDR